MWFPTDNFPKDYKYFISQYYLEIETTLYSPLIFNERFFFYSFLVFLFNVYSNTRNTLIEATVDYTAKIEGKSISSLALIYNCRNTKGELFSCFSFTLMSILLLLILQHNVTTIDGIWLSSCIVIFSPHKCKTFNIHQFKNFLFR